MIRKNKHFMGVCVCMHVCTACVCLSESPVEFFLSTNKGPLQEGATLIKMYFTNILKTLVLLWP